MTLQRLIDQFLRDDAGTPLGPGMPSGRPLRLDGETHYEAWQALLRRDPCAFCGAAASGTVDHVEPRSRTVRGLGATAHVWLNLAGACTACNGAKRDLDLLEFLRRRRWAAGCAPAFTRRRARAHGRAPTASGSPASGTRSAGASRPSWS